jgi:hypothetical protein
MKPEDSLKFSQQPITSPYSESDEFIPHSYNLFS